MLLRVLQVGIIETNCYIVSCPATKEAVVIDPGDEAPRILDAVERDALTVRYVLNTHGHFDHIGANRDLIAATRARLAMHPADIPVLLERGGAPWFGIELPESPLPDLELSDGLEIEFGTLRFRVLHVPGHSPGSVAFYFPDEQAVFVGDVLFAGGVGRTDLPGGDWKTLQTSILNVLFTLPDETRVCPGHGGSTTIGREKRQNPWVGKGISVI